jgi:hypothetical protein
LQFDRADFLHLVEKHHAWWLMNRVALQAHPMFSIISLVATLAVHLR